MVNRGMALLAFLLCFVLVGKASAQDALADWVSATNDPDLKIIISDTQPGCSGNLKAVNDLATYGALSSYRGVTQAAQQIVYSRSTCFDEKHLNRWKVDVGVAHLGGGGFRSESAMLGVGGEFHPIGKAPAFSITPVARVGYDDFTKGGDRFTWGGELTAQYIVDIDVPKKLTLAISEQKADGPKEVYSPGRQLVLAVRGAYQHQSVSFATAPNQIDDHLTGFVLMGLDSHFKNRHLRWQALASYQSLEGGLIKGYGSIELSIRKLSADYQNYRRVYKIIGNFGDRYQALLLSIDFRF